jgi:hypothetical protein
MAIYKDSLGNVYTSLPTKKPTPGAKKRRNKPLPKRTWDHANYKKARDVKYALYRTRRGRPNGPGQPGNKSGKNKIAR